MADLDTKLNSRRATRKSSRGCCDECDPEREYPPMGIIHCPIGGCCSTAWYASNMEAHVLRVHYDYKFWCLQCANYGEKSKTRLKAHYLAFHPKCVREIAGIVMTAREHQDDTMGSPDGSSESRRSRNRTSADRSAPVMTRSRYKNAVHGLDGGFEVDGLYTSVGRRSGSIKPYKENRDSEDYSESPSVMTRARYKRYISRNSSDNSNTRRRPTQEKSADSEMFSGDEDKFEYKITGMNSKLELYSDEEDDGVNVKPEGHSNEDMCQQISPPLPEETLAVPESPFSSQISLSSLAEEDFEVHEEPKSRVSHIASDDPFIGSLDNDPYLVEKARLCYENFCPQFPLLDATLLNGANPPASTLHSIAAIGELSSGNPVVAHDIWNSGMSIMQQFLANPENIGLEWVQACIPLFEVIGLFAFSINGDKYKLFNTALVRCIEDEPKVAEEGEGKETLVRAIWGHYVLEQLKLIFNHGMPSLSFQNLTTRMPHYESEYIIFNNDTLSTLMDQLSLVPVDLLECHLTGLGLLLAIFETQQREQDSQKSMARLTNLCASVSCSPYYSPQHMTLFWSLVHLLKIEAMLNFCRSQPIGLFPSDPIKVLKVDLVQWREIIQSLTPHQRVEAFVQNTEPLHWALHTLATYSGDIKELPLVRLTTYRIIYVCWLLLVALESNPTAQNLWIDIANKLSPCLPSSGTPSQQLASFATIQLQSPGAWGIGQKLPPLS